MKKRSIKYCGRVQELAEQYSLLTGRGDGDSLDFGHKDSKLGWTKSSQDGGCRWFDDGPIVPADIPVLLQHFGLTVSQDDRLSHFETVRYMSPAELIAIRRKLEARTGARKLEAISDRCGGHIPAEMVTCAERVLA